MAQKPSIPKGTRDFSPVEMVRRNYIFDTIKDVFRLYGFQPIETPAMENLSTLMGKYGEEGDKLLFKILDSGDFVSNVPYYPRGLDKKELSSLLAVDNSIIDFSLEGIRRELNRQIKPVTIDDNLLNNIFDDSRLKNLNKYIFFDKNNKLKSTEELKSYLNGLTAKKLKSYINSSIQLSRHNYFSQSSKLTSVISEKGLRYDLTVPFARYVVQYRNDIVFPFKRYQIQPVWRADRPQKGRYREFYQCDVDVIGSDSLLNEAELVQIIDNVFQRLQINTVVKVNNRKILAGIAEAIGEAERIVDITVAIDKLDKIGLEKVNTEMLEKGISQTAIDKLQPILKLVGNTSEKLEQIEVVIGNTEVGAKGIEEMQTLFAYLSNFDLKTEVELDLTLARGLNYYTGAIFEVKSKDVQIGSICGGGRYDDLTGIFGMPDVSGVGVSFGAERIYDVLTSLNLFPQDSLETTKVLFTNFGEKEEAYCLPVLAQLRKSNINAEIFPESGKMKKQMNYANRKEIPFVVLAGEEEMASKKFTLKNMQTGDQQLVSTEELIKILS